MNMKRLLAIVELSGLRLLQEEDCLSGLRLLQDEDCRQRAFLVLRAMRLGRLPGGTLIASTLLDCSMFQYTRV